MGFDFQDILLNIERSFGISISFQDPELPEALRTVRNLYELILRRLGDKPRGQVAASAYELLRGALASIAGGDVDRIEPVDPLSAYLPVFGRRAAWERIENQLELRLPSLELAEGIGLLLALSPFVMGWVFVGTSGVVWGLLALTITAMIALRLARSLAVCFPTRLESGWIFYRHKPAVVTVSDLSEKILAMNYGRLAERANCWSSEEIWESLRKILVEVLQVGPEEIAPEARFVEDLGAN